MSEPTRTMKDLNRQINPFICTDEPYPIHSSIWRIAQSLAIIDHALDFKEDDAIGEFGLGSCSPTRSGSSRPSRFYRLLRCFRGGTTLDHKAELLSFAGSKLGCSSSNDSPTLLWFGCYLTISVRRNLEICSLS